MSPSFPLCREGDNKEVEEGNRLDFKGGCHTEFYAIFVWGVCANGMHEWWCCTGERRTEKCWSL